VSVSSVRQETGTSKGLEASAVALAVAEKWCNGCGKPMRFWGPVCSGMVIGDYTHYHSPEYWRNRITRDAAQGVAPKDSDPSAGGAAR
jgi:hypothetical protein